MDPVALPTLPPEHPILDHAALVEAGMAQLERLAGPDWTDFNAHDPGITLLEAGCYALTDLGYRIFHPIQDLLADDGGTPAAGLLTPAQALTGRAVTLDDLRRVVLDVEGVKNAWIERVAQPAVPLLYDDGPKDISIDTGQAVSPTAAPVLLSGLYRVLVEKSDLEDVDSAVLRRNVALRLHDNRNLCEDFEEITILGQQPIALLAGIEIGQNDNGEDVLLGVLDRVGALISPAVGFLTLSQALAGGAAIDAVLEGPALQRGIVDTNTLAAAERRVALHVSDVIQEIMSVPGVRAVRTIRLAVAGDTVGEAWSLTLDATAAPRLDLTASRIALFKGRVEVAVDPTRVATLYRGRARAARLFQALPPTGRDLAAPRGQDRQVAAYVPLHADLPLLYGVGLGALPDTASDARRAQANQLRSYLTLFDQLLANQFAQLAQTRRFFSAEADMPASYVSQLVGELTPDDQAIGLAPILAPGFDATAVQALVEPPGAPAAIERRNRFLNHLLARVGEAITDDPRTSGAPGATDDLDARLATAKRSFLSDIQRLSGARGSGCNYLAARGDSTAPALADRIRLKLGLPADPALRFLVVEHILLRAIAADAPNALPFLAASMRDDPFSLQVTFVFPTRLQYMAASVETVTREETPAHLVAYIRWLDAAPFAEFAAAHSAWLVGLRRFWLADRLGLDPDAAGAGDAA